MEKLCLFYYVLCRIVLALAFGLTIPLTSLSQCDECGNSKVTLYDATVNVPEPSFTDTIAYLRWLGLSNIGAFARTIIQEEDPSKDCLFFVDMGTRLMGIEDSSVYGVENITPAPDDSSAGNALLFGYFGTSQEASVTRLETLDENGKIIGYYYANSMTTGITGEESYPGLYFNKSGSGIF